MNKKDFYFFLIIIIIIIILHRKHEMYTKLALNVQYMQLMS